MSIETFRIGSANGELPRALTQIRNDLHSEALITNDKWAAPASLRSAAHRARLYLKQHFPEVNYAVGEQLDPPALHIYVRKETPLPIPSANAPQTDPRTAATLLGAEWMYMHYADKVALSVRLALRSNRDTFLQLEAAGALSPKFIAEGRELIARLELHEARMRETAAPKKIWEVVLSALERGESPKPAEIFALGKAEKLIPQEFRIKLQEYEVL